MNSRVRKIVLPILLSTTLAGCFGGGDEIKANTFMDFTEEARNMYYTISSEMGIGQAENFAVALAKIGVYNAFDPSQIDLSKGLLEVDVASVVAKDSNSRLTAAYSVIGSQAATGITLTEIQNLARQMEGNAVLSYSNHVDNFIYDLGQKRSRVVAYVDNMNTVLGSVITSGTKLNIGNNGSFNTGSIDVTITNGSSVDVSEMALSLSVVDNAGNVIASGIENVKFLRSIAVGETKELTANIINNDILSLPLGTYSVTATVVSVVTKQGETLSNTQALEALAYLDNMISETEAYKNKIQQMFDKSFDRVTVF